MKKNFIFLAIFIFCNVAIFGQKQESKNVLRTSKAESEKTLDYKKEYYLQKDKLKACFVNGKIPSDFPRGSHFSSKGSYKTAVLSYIKANSNLIVASEVKKYEHHLNNIDQQQVVSEQQVKEERLNIYKRTTPQTQEEIQQRELKQQQLHKNN